LPARIGSHDVVARIGVGGSTEILLAVTRGPMGFARRVVIKRLRGSLAVDPDARRTLQREALAYARLDHPNVLRLHEVLEHDLQVALVLEYVPGLSLGRLRAGLRERREAIGDAAAMLVMREVFSALAAAHGARDPLTGEFVPVIHRDVNPANVLLGWDGRVKLADFGIAKLTGVSGDTRAGLLKGTYGYMAPEQVTGEPVTVRTDVYAACFLLRELLLRRRTYVRHGVPELELLQAMAHPALAPVECLRTGVPGPVCRALRAGLSPDSAQRTVSAAEIADILADEIDERAARERLVATLEEVRAAEPWSTEEQDHTTEPRASALLALVALERENDGDGDTQRRPPPDAEERVAPPPRTDDEGSISRVKPVAPPAAAVPNAAPGEERVREDPATGDALPAVRDALPTVRDALPTVRDALATVHDALLPLRSALLSTGARRGLRVAAIGFAGVVLVALVAAALASPRVRAALRPARVPQATAAARRTARSSTHLPHAPRSPRHLSAAIPASAALAATGELVTAPLADPHRVFVDGRVVGQTSAPGARFVVACGRHAVRVGSHGQLQIVEVPCNGSVLVSPRW
jgi:serine/threonine protein kinase